MKPTRRIECITVTLPGPPRKGVILPAKAGLFGEDLPLMWESQKHKRGRMENISLLIP